MIAVCVCVTFPLLYAVLDHTHHTQTVQPTQHVKVGHL